MRKDTYANFAALAAVEQEGLDYRIRVRERPGCRVLILTPHGGKIEPGTSTIVEAVAGEDFNWYCFEGIKPARNKTLLHLTSPHFDEPRCLALLHCMDIVVTIHGCTGTNEIYLGGLDLPLVEALRRNLAARYPVTVDPARFPAKDPANTCNRGARRAGAQVEISRDLRKTLKRGRLAAAIRRAIEDHLAALTVTGGLP